MGSAGNGSGPKPAVYPYLEMTRGYWQVPLDEESVSAFVTPFCHFQWRYMPFGWRNSFSRIVNKLLSGLESF